MGGKDHVLSADDASHHHAIPQLQRSLHRVCQAAHDALLHDDAVHHHLDGMLLIFRELDVIGKGEDVPIHAHTDITLLAELFQELFMRPLLRDSDRPKEHELRSFRKGKERIDDLIHRLPPDRLAAVRTEGTARMCIEHTEVVMDLRHCTDRRARVMAGGFLIDGNRRRKPCDLIHVRLIHLP